MAKIIMNTKGFFYWQVHDGFWLGYLQEHPDFLTQGLTLSDLKENLKDIYKDINSGLVPNV